MHLTEIIHVSNPSSPQSVYELTRMSEKLKESEESI